MTISDVELEALKRAHPLSKYAARIVKLNRQGKNLVGCCPFHAEKTGSFTIFPEETFHCFGCGEHGDIITFIEKTENLTFPEAAAKLGAVKQNDGPKIDRIMSQKKTPAPPKVYRKPDAHKVQPVGDDLIAWFSNRKIQAKTTKSFGLYAVTKAYPGDEVLKSIVFPYVWKGEIVNRKYRPLAKKHPMMQEKDARPTLYNADALPNAHTIIFVEGEIDVLSVHEAGLDDDGFPAAVSLKDGASEGSYDKRMEALDTHATELALVKKFILAGDTDAPGQALMAELARRLGRHRCWVVEWPADCKDANEVLIKHGPGTVYHAIKEAAPYPVSGVQLIKPGKTIAGWLSREQPPLMTCGTPKLDAMLRLPSDGRLIVVTGIPSHGKSSLTAFVMVNLMEAHDQRCAVFTPEQSPWEDFVVHCLQIRIRAPLMLDAIRMGAPVADVEAAERWLAERLFIIETDATDESPTLEWLLERAEMLILRFGVRNFFIDPWNEMTHVREGKDRDEYVSDALHRIKHWAKRYSCNVWIVAHPTKLTGGKPGSPPPEPTLYDVKGGSEWYDKADIGLSVHRLEYVSTVRLLKSRFSRWGKRGESVALRFDPATGRYRDQESESPPGDYQGGLWSDG